MTIYRVEIDGDQELDGVLSALMLGAAGVLNERFPDQTDEWRDAMARLSRMIGAHAAPFDDTPPRLVQ